MFYVATVDWLVEEFWQKKIQLIQQAKALSMIWGKQTNHAQACLSLSVKRKLKILF